MTLDRHLAAPPALLEARDIVQEFIIRGARAAGRPLQALAGVSFEIGTAEIFGLVGESGSGKTTLARALLQSPRPQSGSVRFRGVELTQLRGRELREQRRPMQLVFQDPFGSLDPRWTVEEIVMEPLLATRNIRYAERRHKLERVLGLVGMPISIFGSRRRRDLSGGQCQRVAIARALTVDPALLICDEAVSALDVLIQAQLLDLFQRLRRELALSYLFISHDLALVQRISDRVAVLYLGRVCEMGPSAALYRNPRHPYTTMLLAAMPAVEPGGTPPRWLDEDLGREVPSAIQPPTGCRFRARCPRAGEQCGLEEPRLRAIGNGHFVACHFPERPFVRAPAAVTAAPACPEPLPP